MTEKDRIISFWCKENENSIVAVARRKISRPKENFNLHSGTDSLDKVEVVLKDRDGCLTPTVAMSYEEIALEHLLVVSSEKMVLEFAEKNIAVLVEDGSNGIQWFHTTEEAQEFLESMGTGAYQCTIVRRSREDQPSFDDEGNVKSWRPLS